MQKKSNTKSRELELYELLKILWDGKIKILIVVLILVATSAGLDLRNEESTSYRISLDIKPSKRSEFIRFIPVNALLEKTDEKTAYKRFGEEFLDYDELITVLKKNSHIKEELSQKSEKDQEAMLYSYARLFTYKPEEMDLPPHSLNNFNTLRFNWHDVDEGKKILTDVLNLILINVKKTTFEELDYFFKIRKDKNINNDLARIIFLTEQRMIAYELNLDYLSEPKSRYFDTFSPRYYLRGYKAIDREIELIKQRKYIDLINLKKNINDLKNTEIKWVDYNLLLSNVRTIKSSKKNSLSIMIILGLIIGVLYVFISNAILPLKKR